MSIQFLPLGIPLSSSFAVSASIVLNTSVAGFPTSASYAEYALTPVGPTGKAGTIVDGEVPDPAA